MAAPYSDDLRKKVMAALERGEKKSQVSNHVQHQPRHD
jgi:cytochrome c-type biogenesis protein CcmH/NrfF